VAEMLWPMHCCARWLFRRKLCSNLGKYCTFFVTWASLETFPIHPCMCHSQMITFCSISWRVSVEIENSCYCIASSKSLIVWGIVLNAMSLRYQHKRKSVCLNLVTNMASYSKPSPWKWGNVFGDTLFPNFSFKSPAWY
jgi:hypothetical protein